jgi:hypothetical protein
MRRWSVLVLSLVLSLPCVAQSFKIGDKAPDLSDLAWLTEMPANLKQTTLVEFIHSSNHLASERIDALRSLAAENHEQLNVVIIVREDDNEGFRMLAENREYYYVIQTDARYLRSVGVNHVPYTYVTDAKRRTLWCGNPLFLDEQTLITLISDSENNDRSLRKRASRQPRR